MIPHWLLEGKDRASRQLTGGLEAKSIDDCRAKLLGALPVEYPTVHF
jgi:hypothetical protein